jgi:CubicO group peptidase (beta-lactamase class C family)
VLTQALEHAYQTRIDSLLSRRLFTPRDVGHPVPAAIVAPQDRADHERDPWRGRMLRGEVHDENASWLGGVSGHAGLFATADDLLSFGEWVLAQRAGRSCGRPCPALSPATVSEFSRRQAIVPGPVGPRLGHAGAGQQRGHQALTRQLRPHGVYRHIHLDRPHPATRGGAAQQPGPSDA